MLVTELSITNVSKAVPQVVIPSVTELRQPSKGLRAVYLGGNDFTDYVTSVHVNGTDGHDLLTITRCQFANQHGNQSIQLTNLLS